MSNRRFVHTHTLQAEFDGAGVLVADAYPLYPRAFLNAHLDDGIMETVVTNWVDDFGVRNDGISMEGVGPSLVGRVEPSLGPLERIGLGGALYFDASGNLSYDPSDMLAQIALLQQQVVLLNSQVQILYATLKQSAFNPYGQASLSGSGMLAASLGIPLQLTAPTLSGNGSLQAAIGFQLPASTTGFFGSGGISAATLVALSIKSAMAGVGNSPAANLTLVPSNFKQVGSQLFAGAGGGTSSLGVGLAASTALAGASGLNVVLPIAIGSSARLAGASGSTAKLNQTMLGSKTLAGAGAVATDLTVRPNFSTLDPVHTVPTIFLSGGNLTLTSGTGGSTGGSSRGTQSRNSGQLYFEVTVLAGASNTVYAGFCDAAFDITRTLGSDADGWSLAADNHTGPADYAGYVNNTYSSVGFLKYGTGAQAGDVIMCAADFTAGQMYVGVNGTWLGGSSSPGGSYFNTFPGNTLYPALSVYQIASTAASQLSFNPGSSAFVYGLPAGYSAWG